MKNLISGVSVLFLLVLSAAPVFAAPLCSAGMIRNTYVFVATGQVANNYCGYTGWMKFNNDGTVQADMVRSCQGFRVPLGRVEGTYEVLQNCTAWASWTFEFVPWVLDIMIADGGKELMFMASDGDTTTITGTAKPR